MLRLLFDEDLNNHVIRGLLRRLPTLDYETTHSLDLAGKSDDEVLLAAAAAERLVISHDVNTMSAAFTRLVEAGNQSYGLLLVPQSLPIGEAIADLELICAATENADWLDRLDFLPI